MSRPDNVEVKTVVVCCITGTQGQEILKRLAKINDARPNGPIMHVRGLTRNSQSKKAQSLLECNPDLTLEDVDYNSKESLMKVFEGADSLYINCTISKDEAQQYERIVDCAIDANIEHIVYSSSSGCELDHGVPHWDTSRHTEQYLKKKHAETQGSFKYHMVRFAHCNENILNYFAPKNGWMAFPWDPSVGIHTASVCDGARVACKMFCAPDLLESGEAIDIITDFKSPNEMAECITDVTGTTTKAYKGPWIFIWFGHWFGYEASTILTMGERIESHWKKEGYLNKQKHDIVEFLQDEIKDEPLESLEAFVKRNFA